MKKIYLVDVSSLFFRAFYAIRQLNNSKGLPTNALYGFLAAVTKILREHKPDGVAFCFDTPEAGFREKLYPDYKANRDAPPDDLVKQFPYLPQIAAALSVPAFDQPGFEADDLIGTLVKKSKRQGVEVIIVSGDKDFAQLVEPGVKIFDPAKDAYMDEEGVRVKFGVNPSQIIDYLALVGDTSDNVPGVKGIGPKGAQKLLEEFKDLKGVYANIDQVKNDRVREKLVEHKKEAFLSYELATIRTDVPLKISAEDLAVKSINRGLLIPLLEELNFKSLLQRLLGEGAVGETGAVNTPTSSRSKVQNTETKNESISVAQTHTEMTPTKKATVTAEVFEIERAFKKAKVPEIWFDVTSRGIALQIEGDVFRFEGDGAKLSNWLNENLESRPVKISGFDTKNIAHQLHLSEKAFQAVGQDVLLEAYCTGLGGSFEFSDLVSMHTTQSLPEFATPEDRLQAARIISNKLQSDLKNDGRHKVLYSIEQPLVPVLYSMERNGILIDATKLAELSKQLSKEAVLLEKEICDAAGYEFNVGSPKQLAQVLFEKLKLPAVRKTKTGYSTDSDVLEKLKHLHPVADKILEWRELTKLRSTYVDALPRLINSETGRVHTSFNQAVTTTGRLSSTHPNLQNIPIRSPRGQMIRESFIAPEGSLLVSADYSQVELRILAHITGDAGLRRAFESDLDIHTATASEVFGVDLNGVTAEHRRAAKAINFGIAYGMSEFGLAESLGVERKVASDFIARYFKRFPGVQNYMHEVVENGKRNQYVETMFGRRRYYPDLNSSNGQRRQMAERAAINMPIQGAAADLIKMAMISMNSGIKEFGPRCMLLQVHDELVFQVEEQRVDELKKKVKIWMETAVKLSVPIKVSVGAGKNWGSAH